MKETVYANERNSLCARAFLSEDTAGRLKALRPCPVRTDFMRDRDRIIHSKSFRRLMHKMQVFLAPEGDHYRTRLTHTLEVTQIARTLARALRLNEDLTEAAALGHDLGHTPFGHSGERALNRLCPNGFRHNEQSLRVADQAGEPQPHRRGARRDAESLGRRPRIDAGGAAHQVRRPHRVHQPRHRRRHPVPASCRPATCRAS